MGENLWDAAVHSQGETPEMSLFASSLFTNLQKYFSTEVNVQPSYRDLLMDNNHLSGNQMSLVNTHKSPGKYNFKVACTERSL
jgi:hypothetical protein